MRAYVGLERCNNLHSSRYVSTRNLRRNEIEIKFMCGDNKGIKLDMTTIKINKENYYSTANYYSCLAEEEHHHNADTEIDSDDDCHADGNASRDDTVAHAETNRDDNVDQGVSEPGYA